MNKKLTIGLVFGGISSEHEVSIKSANTIYTALSHSYNQKRYIVNPIYIDKNGFWGDYEYSKSILTGNNRSTSIIESNKVSIKRLSNLAKESEKIDITNINDLTKQKKDEVSLSEEDIWKKYGVNSRYL